MKNLFGIKTGVVFSALLGLLSISASAQLIDFGYVQVGTYKDSMAVFQNPFPYSIGVTSSYLTASPSDFSIIDGAAPFPLAPGAKHKFVMRFAPSHEGLQEDVLVVEGTFPNSPLNVPLRAIGIPLPVELQSFTASRRNGKVHLEWRTASETNNFGFAIQRSISKNDTWTQIGFVAGNGTTMLQQSYDFVDDLRETGFENFDLQYRLQQYDNDGSSEYSPVVHAAEQSIIRTVTLSQNYPNPVQGSTSFIYEIPEAGFVSLKLYSVLDSTEEVLFEGLRQPGRYSVKWNPDKHPHGMYFYRLTANNATLTKTLILK